MSEETLRKLCVQVRNWGAVGVPAGRAAAPRDARGGDADQPVCDEVRASTA